MHITVSAAPLTDREFVDAFEFCRLPNEWFHHRDHLRLAWIYVRRYGAAAAGGRSGESIRRYAAHHGQPGFRRIGLGECRGVVQPALAAVSKF